MKTLEEHNETQRQIWAESNKPKSMKNGIACPTCGNELNDGEVNVTLTTNPPQKNVYCDCGYRGYRVA